MLEPNMRAVGNNLLGFRKRAGLTQAELAEAAGVADRTYADIERGSVIMRVSTLLRICGALHITPNDILTRPDSGAGRLDPESLPEQLRRCSTHDRETALALLSVYLRSCKQEHDEE